MSPSPPPACGKPRRYNVFGGRPYESITMFMTNKVMGWLGLWGLVYAYLPGAIDAWSIISSTGEHFCCAALPAFAARTMRQCRRSSACVHVSPRVPRLASSTACHLQ
jgi:hypothetical protein